MWLHYPHTKKRNTNTPSSSPPAAPGAVNVTGAYLPQVQLPPAPAPVTAPLPAPIFSYQHPQQSILHTSPPADTQVGLQPAHEFELQQQLQRQQQFQHNLFNQQQANQQNQFTQQNQLIQQNQLNHQNQKISNFNHINNKHSNLAFNRIKIHNQVNTLEAIPEIQLLFSNKQINTAVFLFRVL